MIDGGPAAGAARFEALTAQCKAAVEAGQLAEALAFSEQALSAAEALGESAALRRASCNRAQILIELGDGESVLAPLRQVLNESRETETSFRAAYALARAYDLKGDRSKAYFYAHIARGHAQTDGNPEFIRWSHNLYGCLLLAESRFEEARAELEIALSTRSSVAVWEAFVQDNLGYCYVVLGRYQEGLALLYRSIWTLRRAPGGLHRFPRLALCYAHLELGHLARAQRHGRAALAAADDQGDRETAKMALYLLGEIAKQDGDVALARAFFGMLQVRFYPNQPQLADVLLQVDARRMVNLKA